MVRGIRLKISFITPHPELAPFVESFWVFESPSGFPATDASIAAPNGCAKLIIPYENSLISIVNGKTEISHEQQLYFVGNMDTSTVIQSSARKTGFIAIEFSPHGAFPIFGIPMSETFNALWECEGLFEHWSRRVRDLLSRVIDVGCRPSALVG